jgi:ribosome maturation factor RimP
VGLPTLLFLWGKMGKDELSDKVQGIIEPVINSLGVELDDLEVGKMRGKGLLRVFIDKEKGVTIDDCETVSREIAAVLDVEDPIPYSYVLEVSSPGLDRPLRKPADFKRFKGNTIRVVTTDPIDEQTFFVGKISMAGDSGVILDLPKKNKVTIPYEIISRARLEVEI